MRFLLLVIIIFTLTFALEDNGSECECTYDFVDDGCEVLVGVHSWTGSIIVINGIQTTGTWGTWPHVDWKITREHECRHRLAVQFPECWSVVNLNNHTCEYGFDRRCHDNYIERLAHEEAQRYLRTLEKELKRLNEASWGHSIRSWLAPFTWWQWVLIGICFIKMLRELFSKSIEPLPPSYAAPLPPFSSKIAG